MVELVPTAKAVTKTLTWTYNKSDGSYTESKSGTNDGSVTASNAFTGNKPLTANARYWYVVKATSASGNTEVTFTCDEKQTDYWSAKSSGTNVGYNRTAQNLIALFSCQKTCQTITLPWYGAYKMECWGAKGGETSLDTRGKAGKGGYTKGAITLEKGFKIYTYVGAIGLSATPTGSQEDKNPGGWNGGGYSGGNGGSTNHTRFSCGGGGSTDFRVVKHSDSNGWSGNNSLRSRIMVAAGGGGSGNGKESTGTGYSITGACGGGLNGGVGTQSPQSYSLATAATQIAGGICSYISSNDGSFGYASQDSSISGFGGGGGGGWYGGARGHGKGGGGGSSFISGMTNCRAVDNNGSPISANYMTITVNETSRIFKFTSTEMIDGEGYVWTSTTRPASATKLSTITSNPGGNNGYAKITSL